MKKYDSIVVGAGVSGLTAALILAKNGRSVALVEQQDYIGPLLHRFKRSGVWCDPGFHYSGGLTQDGTLSVLFRYLGIDKDIETIPMPAEGFDIIVQDGREYKIPYGFEALQTYLSTQFPDSAEAIIKYIEKLTEIFTTTGFLNFDLEFDAYADDLYSNQSLAEFLIEIGAEPKLIRLLGNHGLVLYGSTAEEVPLFVHASAMGSFYQSAHTIRGGADNILKGFRQALAQENVELFLGDGVEKFKIDEKRHIQGVHLGSGETLLSDNVISSLHPWALADKLPRDKVRPAFISRLKSLENTFSPFMAFYKLEKFPEKIKESNYYIFQKEKPYLDMAFMAANQRAEYKGSKALAILKPVPESYFKNNTNGEYAAQKMKIQQEITTQVLQIFPELKESLTYLDGATAKTIYRYTRSPDGSIYGIKPTVRQMNLSPQTSVRGLYMSGQSVQSGVMGAMISAFMAAGNIVGMEELRKQVVKWV